MLDFISGLTGLGVFYLVCGVLGGVMVAVRTVMQFAGMDDDGGEGPGMDGDFDGGGDDGGDADGDDDDSDLAFRFLSIHGLSAFFMMFGFVGLAIHHESAGGVLLSLIGGIGAGFVSVWIIQKLYRFMNSLQSSGTMGIRDAVGSRGTVYVTIPANGTGQVQISLDNRIREYDARTGDGKTLRSGEGIEVTGVRGDVLIVRTLGLDD